MVAPLSLGNKAETSLRADGVRVGAEPQRALLLLPAGKGEDSAGWETRRARLAGPWPGGQGIIFQERPLSDYHFPGFKINHESNF